VDDVGIAGVARVEVLPDTAGVEVDGGVGVCRVEIMIEDGVVEEEVGTAGVWRTEVVLDDSRFAGVVVVGPPGVVRGGTRDAVVGMADTVGTLGVCRSVVLS
jgi:hypothetical protein